MSNGWTDTGEIERELEDTRSRLDATIGALQQKLAPGPMVDQAVEYFTRGWWRGIRTKSWSQLCATILSRSR